jgi:phage tail-like protein
MATPRDNPYGAFNFLVSWGGKSDGSGGDVQAGFSDASGLGYEVNYSDYRTGNEKTNTVRHVPNTFKNDEITLKRGVIGSDDIFSWLKSVREGTYDPRTVTVTLYDEARNQVAQWVLTKAQPKKWVGPTLAAKGGGDVAMEELHLVHEGIEYK